MQGRDGQNRSRLEAEGKEELTLAENENRPL